MSCNTISGACPPPSLCLHQGPRIQSSTLILINIYRKVIPSFPRLLTQMPDANTNHAKSPSSLPTCFCPFPEQHSTPLTAICRGNGGKHTEANTYRIDENTFSYAQNDPQTTHLSFDFGWLRFLH